MRGRRTVEKEDTVHLAPTLVGCTDTMPLGDARRVKSLSPAAMVVKRFLRNKLAVVGLSILVVLFFFCFVGAAVYPYSQSQTFSTRRPMMVDYAYGQVCTSYKNVPAVEEAQMPSKEVRYSMNGYIAEIERQIAEGGDSRYVPTDDDGYVVTRLADKVYVLARSGEQMGGDSDSRSPAAKDCPLLYATTMCFDRYDLNSELTADFQAATLSAIGEMAAEGVETRDYRSGAQRYAVTKGRGGYEVTVSIEGKAVPYVSMSDYSIRLSTGEDALSVRTKAAFRTVMDKMMAEGALSSDGESIEIETPVAHDGGIEAKPQYAAEDFYVYTEDKGFGRQFVFCNVRQKAVLDIYAKPSKEHILGLDGNGMDMLARIMYGGRISLLIGFVVVLAEMVLGAIFGGIAGYCGGVVDNIIMRLVDVFYCIPTLPILIILGATLNALKVDNTLRLLYMMAILGLLGWPSVARMVRGQILALRGQDFMMAAEASGLSAGRKIFRHLLPNVIPQLIVQATMGLGGVILTESTLSFLGLGVKYPMATWGQIINSVKEINDMQTYTYIWIPVGALICLAVIAFNFVGDGLRDAFDPKTNR